LEVREMEYDKMNRKELELFNPLIEVTKKGLKDLKDKYSFEEAWKKFGDFLYVSHILLSSEHPYNEIYWAPTTRKAPHMEEKNPDVFGSYAYDWHKKFWNYPAEKIFGLSRHDEVGDEEEEEEEADW
jgi:hypothetical protein